MSLLKHFRSSKVKHEANVVAEPQVGFKLAYNNRTGEISVKILGAKQLPTSYGNTKTQGYSIKVTVFPQKDKFETKIVEQSWPTFDEEFKFKIQSHSRSGDSLKGKFISFTAYALLYGEREKNKENKTFISKFVAFASSKQKKDNRMRRSFRHSLSNRRTVGSVSYNLEDKNFSVRISDEVRSTPEIWRGLREISSGMSNTNKDNKKGSVEVTMLYTISEEGNKDLIEVGVSKLRCNIQTMEEHERLGGKLYLKISAFEMDDVIQKMKSDKFDPTISLKLEKKSARLKVKVDEHSCNQLRILIKLMCTPLLGHKLELGRIEIDSRSDIWRDMVKTPMVPITRAINLE